ncbi:MAG: AMP-binding protein, partial [Telluria sp.]
MSDLFSHLEQRQPAAIAGWRGAQAVSHADWLGRVSAWRALALRTGAVRVALYLDDSVEFGAALIGLWQAGI